MKTLLSLLSLLLVNTAAVTAQTTIRMTVNEVPQSCQRMMPMTCLQVQKDGSKEWELFYDRIKGFDYEPGYRYEIVVIQTERPEPVAQDLSKYLYTLDKIVSKTAMPVSGSVTGWKVSVMSGKGLNDETMHFAFNEDFTQLSGKSGCNTFNVPVKLSKNRKKLKTEVVMSTKMACNDQAMMNELEFGRLMNNATFRLKQRDGKWVWKKKGKEAFVLEAQQPMEQRMETKEEPRTPWDYFSGQELKVIQLNGENLADTRARLVFDQESGRFSGNNGCNQVSGAYAVNGNAIHFSKVMSTKMACNDEAASKTEREMQAIFGQEGLTVDYAEQVINIYDMSGKLILMLAVTK